VAVIGELAADPVYQGGGSSHVTPTRLDVPLDEIRCAAGIHAVTFARGYTGDGAADTALCDEAVGHAGAADTAIVFLGLPPSAESEGWDRDHIDLPAEQIQLLRAVVEVQPRTVAVLSHGGVVTSGVVAESAAAVLDGALLGQAGGGALADVLFGRVNPSGRLAETVPLRLQDVPSYLNFPGDAGHVHYGERIFVGYRGYDACDRDVAFPFGHGLSYTNFHYDGLSVALAADEITVRLTVTNTGRRRGREVVQAYAGLPGSAVTRPPRWLVSFGDVTLDPGEARECILHFGTDELAHWATARDRWVLEGGDYTIGVGASSRDLRLTGTVTVPGDEVRGPLTLESTLAEVLADPVAGPAILSGFAAFAGQDAMPTDAMGTDMLKMMGQIPIGRIVAFSGGAVSRDDLQALLDGGVQP
jgi:beta-glucosidase